MEASQEEITYTYTTEGGLDRVHIPSWHQAPRMKGQLPAKPAEHWYVDTHVPGRLLTPMLAEDRFIPAGAHWVRQMATYTFSDLLVRNFPN